MDDIMTLSLWHWWALAALLIGAEMMVASTWLLGPALAALITGLVAAIAPEIGHGQQVVIFSVLAIAATAVIRLLFKRSGVLEKKPNSLNQRAATLIGRKAELRSDFSAGYAEVKIDDTIWRVRYDGSANLKAGDEVKITAVDGTTLSVEPSL